MESFEFQTREASASTIVRDCMVEFTIEVAAQKVSNIVDGLKSIHRRILWTMGANEKWINLNTFVGRITEIHPVGDKSISEACIRCAQDHSIALPLLRGQGNLGGYDSEDAGANRYLKVMISPIARDLFFDGVNLKTLPMKETEDFMNMEPIHFIPRLPTSLLLYTLTLGVGFKSEIFPMSLENVCILVQKYLEHRARYGKSEMDVSKLGHLFIPDFPIRNTIRNVDEITKSYAHGQFAPSIVVDGVIDVHPNMIVLKTVPFGTQFEKTDKLLRSLLQDKKSWIYDLRTGYQNLVDNSSEGAACITFKRGVDTFDVAYRLIKELKLSQGIRSIPNYVNRSGRIFNMTPMKLVEIWHNVRKDSIFGGIKSDQIQNMRQTLEKRTKLLVADKWDKIEPLIKSKDLSINEIFDRLTLEFDLSYHQAKILVNSPIITLHKQSKESLMDEIAALEKKAIVLKDHLEKVDDIIYSDTEYFRKKYSTPRKTKITPYIGYVCVAGRHIVQFDTFDEGQDLLEKFPGSKIYFYQDQKKMPIHYYTSKDVLQIPKMSLPKMFEGQSIIEVPEGPVYSLCVAEENTAFIVEGIRVTKKNNDNVVIPVTKQFWGVYADGTVISHSVKDFTSRKSINAAKGKKSDLIYAIPAIMGEMVMVHMNTIDPTSIYFNLLTPGDTIKVPISVLGTTEFLGIVSPKQKSPIMMNLPDWVGIGFKYLTISDVSSLMGGSSTIMINATRKSTKDSRIRTSMII